MSAIWEMTSVENAFFAMFSMPESDDKRACGSVSTVETHLHNPNIVANPLVDFGDFLHHFSHHFQTQAVFDHFLDVQNALF